MTSGMTPSPTDRGALRQHLLQARIAGNVATSREDNLRKATRMAQGRPGYDFGLAPARSWSPDEVLDVMARRCGVRPDPTYLEGPDTIDVELTLAALDAVRDRLAVAGARRERVLVATGHPTGILALHLAAVQALRAAGATVLVPDLSWSWPWEREGDWSAARPRHVRSIGGVHMLASGGELLHTHAAEPGRALLDALDSQPDLVVADHGWAGVAAQAGLEVLSYADCNDPALFVAQEEGLDITVVPLDDNVLPHLYDPVSAYLTSWAV